VNIKIYAHIEYNGVLLFLKYQKKFCFPKRSPMDKEKASVGWGGWGVDWNGIWAV